MQVKALYTLTPCYKRRSILLIRGSTIEQRKKERREKRQIKRKKNKLPNQAKKECEKKEKKEKRREGKLEEDSKGKFNTNWIVVLFFISV